MVPLWMMANAIACGNCFVLKPSEKDPSASLVLADMVQRAGFPDGVFNVVQGDREAVETLLAHPDVAAISFVGSTPVARHIYETGTRSTASGSRHSEARRTTWSCCPTPTSTPRPMQQCPPPTGQRGAVHGDLGGRRGRARARVPLIDAIADRIPDVRRAGDDAASMMGPLITAEHRDRVRSYVEGAADEGAKVVVNGSTELSRGWLLRRLLPARRREARHARR